MSGDGEKRRLGMPYAAHGNTDDHVCDDAAVALSKIDQPADERMNAVQSTDQKDPSHQLFSFWRATPYAGDSNHYSFLSTGPAHVRQPSSPARFSALG